MKWRSLLRDASIRDAAGDMFGYRADNTPTGCISDEWFVYLSKPVDGKTKTVEGRNAGYCARKGIIENKPVYWTSGDGSQRKKAMVTRIVTYDSLSQYLAAEKDAAAPQYATVEEARAAYLAIDDNGRPVFMENSRMEAIHFYIIDGQW